MCSAGAYVFTNRWRGFVAYSAFESRQRDRGSQRSQGDVISRQKTKDKRQKTKDKRQKTKGKRQKTKGKRQKKNECPVSSVLRLAPSA